MNTPPRFGKADAARKQISTFETQVLEQMEAFEGAEKELNERAPEVEKLREDMQARFVEFDEQVARQQKELDSSARRTRAADERAAETDGFALQPDRFAHS
jgi:hypothetical protein